MNPEDLTLAQIDDLIAQENAELDLRNARLRSLVQIRDRKHAQAEAAKTLRALNPAQRQAVIEHAQTIANAGAVSSESAFGTP